MGVALWVWSHSLPSHYCITSLSLLFSHTASRQPKSFLINSGGRWFCFSFSLRPLNWGRSLGYHQLPLVAFVALTFLRVLSIYPQNFLHFTLCVYSPSPQRRHAQRNLSLYKSNGQFPVGTPSQPEMRAALAKAGGNMKTAETAVFQEREKKVSTLQVCVLCIRVTAR